MTSKLKIHSVAKEILSRALEASQVVGKVEVVSIANNKVVLGIFLNNLRRCLVVVKRVEVLEMVRCRGLKVLILR